MLARTGLALLAIALPAFAQTVRLLGESTGGDVKERCRRHALGVVVFALAAGPAAAQNQQWIRQLGTTTSDVAFCAAPDGSSGVYLAGDSDGSLGGANAGLYDVWLARFDSAGNQMWIRQFGTGLHDYVRTAAPDGSGGAYVAGMTGGVLGGASAGGYDAWLARFDSAGNQLWIQQLGTVQQDFASTAAPDGVGGVYVGGWTLGDLGGPNAGAQDAWLARYDDAGNQLWMRQLGTIEIDEAWAVAPDGAGGVYLGGKTDGSLGGSSAGGTDAWLARYDGAGYQLWIRQLGTSTIDYAWTTTLDGSGGVCVSGLTYGSLGGPSAGGQDVWLARYDSAGNQLWIRQLGTTGFDAPNAGASDGVGGLYLSGETTGALGGPNAGLVDAWLARFDSSGNQNWICQLGTTAVDYAYAVAWDGFDGVYVGGETSGSLGGPTTGERDAWLARYDSCAAPTTYCTAKPNSLGCTPSIAWTGTPSLTGTSDDFHITASNVLNNKNGLLFWGTAEFGGPFQGGTLCVKPPVARTDVQNSGGNPPPNDCSGSYDFHLSQAYMQQSLFQVGTTIYAQYWSRDPGFGPPNNVGLTDGLRVVVCP